MLCFTFRVEGGVIIKVGRLLCMCLGYMLDILARGTRRRFLRIFQASRSSLRTIVLK